MGVSALLQGGALVVTVLGLGSGLLVLARHRDVRQALAVLLDFLFAAGLLRLSDQATYRALATAAVIVAIRKLVMFGLRQGSARRTGSPSARDQARLPRRPVGRGD